MKRYDNGTVFMFHIITKLIIRNVDQLRGTFKKCHHFIEMALSGIYVEQYLFLTFTLHFYT